MVRNKRIRADLELGTHYGEPFAPHRADLHQKTPSTKIIKTDDIQEETKMER